MTSVAKKDHFTLDQHGFAVRSHHFDIMALDNGKSRAGVFAEGRETCEERD
jgi:hypothetical protein